MQAAFTEPTVVHAWFKQARKDLKGGRVNDFIARMQTLVENSSGERQKTLAGQLAYFTKGQQHQRLNYSQVTAMKLPIGSGAIESLIRQVVNLLGLALSRYCVVS